MQSKLPARGEIWIADLGDRKRHWCVILSLNSRNQSERSSTVLLAPFSASGWEGPTTLRFDPGETGLPAGSYLRCHYITTLNKSQLIERVGRPLSARRMRQVTLAIRRAFDPDAPWQPTA
jgi:mRNA-degrading endonuclease toxin of MazEF toxin-antitoxin module